MYSICYVLTDNEKLQIFNELMISVSSLRYQGHTGPVFVVTNSQTAEILSTHADELEKYQLELVPVSVPEKYSPMEASRYIKTSLRECVAGDFLFVDTDTVFADKLPAYISDEEIASVPDRHIKYLSPGIFPYRYVKPFYEKMGIEDIEGKTYYNSGVIWVRDTEKAHIFYREWHKNWLEFMGKGIPFDQQAYNYTSWENGQAVSLLPDVFNVQVSTAVVPFTHISKGYILHYFHPRNAVYLLAKKEIRNCPYDSEVIQSIIKSPKSAFIDGELLPYDSEEAEFKKTYLYSLFFSTFVHRRKLFYRLQSALSGMMRVREKLLKLVHNK